MDGEARCLRLRHDLSTPVGTILMTLDVIGRVEHDPVMEQHLARLGRAAAAINAVLEADRRSSESRTEL